MDLLQWKPIMQSRSTAQFMFDKQSGGTTELPVDPPAPLAPPAPVPLLAVVGPWPAVVGSSLGDTHAPAWQVRPLLPQSASRLQVLVLEVPQANRATKTRAMSDAKPARCMALL